MDELLTPVSTKYTKPGSREPVLLQEVEPVKPVQTAPTATAHSAEEALEILRNEPDYDALVSVLRFLRPGKGSFDVRHPTPLSAQIVQVLVTAILPNYWTLLQEDEQDGRPAKDQVLFLASLRSITGLRALVIRLRALLAEAKTDSAKEQLWQLGAVMEILSKVLSGDASVFQIWDASMAGIESESKRRPLSQEYLNTIGGGRIVSVSAEAEAVVKERSPENSSLYWIASGKEYSRWLTRGIIHWDSRDANEGKKLRGELLGKAMRLGYPDTVITTLVEDLLLQDVKNGEHIFTLLLEQLPAHDQKKILAGILRTIPELITAGSSTEKESALFVSTVAGFIKQAVGSSRVVREQLNQWLLSSSAVGIENGADVLRAVVAVVAEDEKSLSDILEKSLAEFGDQLFIKHTPVMQQETKAQVILLAAGYVHRANARTLASLLRSRTYLSVVSNRLGASQLRARFLGMVVGEALSGLVDGAKKLVFDMDETNSEDAKWYKGLVNMQDTVGPVDWTRLWTKTSKNFNTVPRKKIPQKVPEKTVRQPRLPRQTGFVVEEVEDDEDDEDDDIVPYGKPDSDAEDSDDDPTMIRRDKPKAPVYIRDLLVYLRDTENYDKQRLGLTTAPVLIRRKATFGTEVQQHARELASVLVGLADTFEMGDFYQLRLQSMTALVVAQPQIVGPWFSSTFFEGDYSLAQRASLLTALGLAARELAGFDVSEYAAAAAFPSKQLSERVERLYTSTTGALPPSSRIQALPAGALDSITSTMTASLLGPLAAKAVDEANGPDFLKLESVQSRLHSSQSNRSTRPKTTSTAPPVIASAIFFPLTGRFQLALQSTAAASSRGVLFDPSLLSLYLKTLAVSLHAVGPGALALPDMTAELWHLLLGSSVQTHCMGDATVTHAVLFALLALLDVNEGRMRDICSSSLAREVVQTRDWTVQVLQKTPNGSGDVQENEIQMLAAGVYQRLTEGMESYRNLLLGELI